MSLLHEKEYPNIIKEPAGLSVINICTSSGKIPKPECTGKVRSEIFLEEYAPYEACDIHKRVKIDSRTGRLAGANTPQKFVEDKTYEQYPSIYDNWFIEHGVKLPEKSLSTQIESEPIVILSPQEGEKFRIDPILKRDYQKIYFRAIVSNKIETVSWFLNGEKLGETKTEHKLEWAIKKGSYRLTVKSGKCESQVLFSVN